MEFHTMQLLLPTRETAILGGAVFLPLFTNSFSSFLRIRIAGIRGIQGVVRKTVNDELRATIWEPQHMDKIVPSLLFNMQKIDDIDRYFYSWSLMCFKHFYCQHWENSLKPISAMQRSLNVCCMSNHSCFKACLVSRLSSLLIPPRISGFHMTLSLLNLSGFSFLVCWVQVVCFQFFSLILFS